jgi:hypothetical protein
MGTTRPAMHVYLSAEAKGQLTAVTDRYGLTYSALIDRLAPRLAAIVDADPAIVDEARAVMRERYVRAR